MSILLRFLGLSQRSDQDDSGDDRAVRRIAKELESLNEDRARFFAAFAYILARVAAADLRIEGSELAEMRQVLVSVAGISEDEARLVVEIAEAQVDELGATDNYLVTREFRRLSSPEQRAQILECLFAVAAADDLITTDENEEIMGIARELGLSHSRALGVRSGFKDKLAEFRRLRGET